MAATDPLGSAKTAMIGNFTLCAAAEVRWRRFVGSQVEEVRWEKGASNHEQNRCPEGSGRCAAGRVASAIHVE